MERMETFNALFNGQIIYREHDSSIRHSSSVNDSFNACSRFKQRMTFEPSPIAAASDAALLSQIPRDHLFVTSTHSTPHLPSLPSIHSTPHLSSLRECREENSVDSGVAVRLSPAAIAQKKLDFSIELAASQQKPPKYCDLQNSHDQVDFTNFCWPMDLSTSDSFVCPPIQATHSAFPGGNLSSSSASNSFNFRNVPSPCSEVLNFKLATGFRRFSELPSFDEDKENHNSASHRIPRRSKESRSTALKQRNSLSNETLVEKLDESDSKMGNSVRGNSEDYIGAVLGQPDEYAELVGDFSREFALPLTRGRHKDLNCITPDTMAAVLRSEYADVIEQCIVVDCRYPYEFAGGHIEGALNLYTEKAVVDQFFATPQSNHHEVRGQTGVKGQTGVRGVSTGKRTILVFHCEFSSERAPKLLRFLRNQDRGVHQESYPSLSYPEIYLLEGGYKAFYEAHCPHRHCQPPRYTPMLHADHAAELRHFRSKSKTWAGENQRQAHFTRRKSLRM